jgi:hypothetical protein
MGPEGLDGVARPVAKDRIVPSVDKTPEKKTLLNTRADATP